jgi:hypothetical protein
MSTHNEPLCKEETLIMALFIVRENTPCGLPKSITYAKHTGQDEGFHVYPAGTRLQQVAHHIMALHFKWHP